MCGCAAFFMLILLLGKAWMKLVRATFYEKLED
jgi:hypothetical protein